VTDDVQDFVNGTYSNYGWLIKKQTSSDTGDIDFASKEHSNSVRWPKLILRVRDWNPPTISCSPDRTTPDQNGWYNHDLTMNCTCDDADGDLVFCPTTTPVTTEGYNVRYDFTAVDAQNLTAMQTFYISLDKTPPAIAITYPSSGATLDTCLPQTTGTVGDALSGVQTTTCNDLDADVVSGSFSCQTALASGPDSIVVQAIDTAGNLGSASVSVTNTTSNPSITLDPGSPVIADIDNADVVGISGIGFEDADEVYLDGTQVPTEVVNSNYLLVHTNFVSPAGVHSLEIKNPNSCPETSSTLEPGILGIKDGEILADPQTIAPDGGQTFSIYAHESSFETGATVYFASSNSNCSQGLVLAQSVTFIGDQQLDVISPFLPTGAHDLFVDNPNLADFCQTDGITVSNPPMGPTGYGALWSCCTTNLPPVNMTTGQTFTGVKLIFKNTGTTTWRTSDGIDLSSYNKYWGLTNVNLPGDIAPGKWATFIFDVTAPKTAGTYKFQWSLRKEGITSGRFGSWAPCTPDSCVSGACGYDCRGGEPELDIVVNESASPPDLGSCPAADPTDGIGDTDAIQDCLDHQSTVELVPGGPGYIIDDGSNSHDSDYALVIEQNKTLQTKGTGGKCWSWDGNINHDPVPDYAHCATLMALAPPQGQNTPVLHRRMIKLEGNGGQTISRIIVDGQGEDPLVSSEGRRYDPALTGKCSGDSRLGNIYVFDQAKRSQGGKKWVIEKSVSMNDMCGSALRTQGVDYVVQQNLIWNNGWSEKINTGGVEQDDPWSDGITAVHCDHGTIKTNTIIDATDVGIASGGIGKAENSPLDCTIASNQIYQHNKHVFSGIGISFFDVGVGNWGNSRFIKNDIDGNNKMDFGIHAGKHPWNETVYVKGGVIGDRDDPRLANTITRASINLNIDGWLNGKIGQNKVDCPSECPSNSFMDLANYDCSACSSLASGKGFTVSDYNDNNSTPTTLDFEKQGTPDEYLTTHSIDVTQLNPSTCTAYSGNGCGGNTSCSVCRYADPGDLCTKPTDTTPGCLSNPSGVDNCACRNTDGTCACVDQTPNKYQCVDCSTGQPLTYMPEAKEQ
jgi:hypothetical protein